MAKLQQHATAADAIAAKTRPEPDRERMKVRRKKQLNARIVSMSHQDYLTVRVDGEMYDAPMGKVARNADGTVPCLPITDLETGEYCMLILPAVFKSILLGLGDYLGRCFELTRGGQEPGKNYRNIEVWEIDDPRRHEFQSSVITPEHDDYATGN